MNPEPTRPPALVAETVQMELDGKTRELRTFPRMSPDSFQHPDDKSASAALQAIPLLPELFKAINSGYMDQRIRMEHLTYNLRLGRTQGEKLYTRFAQAVRILGLPVMPELYLSPHPMIYAYTAGTNQPVVVLSQGTLSQLSEAEILGVIGHELGHIKCRHGLYKSLGSVFASAGVSGLSSMFPVLGPTALMGVNAALSHWSRMAEFSCDRAALLVVQDREVVASMLAKISGFHRGVVPDFNVDALFSQLADYERFDQSAFQSLVKMQKLLLDALDENLTHPSPIMRIKRILDWGASDHYGDIMDGQYMTEEITGGGAYRIGSLLSCAACGKELQEGAKFCSFCGMPA